jgi:hypothetical protein
MYEYTTLPGYYSEARADRQKPCPTGTYNPLTAQSNCSDCPAGFYCPNTATSDLLLDCPKGSFCPKGTTTPTKCGKGTFNNEYNGKSAADCKPCTPGYYCKDDGLVDPSDKCSQGYYCIKGAELDAPESYINGTAGPCPVGHYCPLASPWPIPCPIGYFSSLAK